MDQHVERAALLRQPWHDRPEQFGPERDLVGPGRMRPDRPLVEPPKRRLRECGRDPFVEAACLGNAVRAEIDMGVIAANLPVARNGGKCRFGHGHLLQARIDVVDATRAAASGHGLDRRATVADDCNRSWRAPSQAAANEMAEDRGLKRMGISVAPQRASGGGFLVRGDTYPHRETLQALGGRWDRAAHAWIFEGGEDPSPRLAEALEPFAGSQPGERPHYRGHRQRLRERALQGGFDALPDYELLELILFGSIRRADTKPLAKALLERFGTLGAVLAAPEEELYGFELVNQQTVTGFRAVRELAARMAREEVIDRPLLNSIDKVVDYCRAKMAYSDVEEFRVLYLDQRNALIHDELQQRGTVNEVAAYPRQIMRRALNLGAVGLVLCHNHPSGNLKPSPQDIEITREIFHAAEAVGITLHDHLIVGAGGHTSLRDLRKIPRAG